MTADEEFEAFARASVVRLLRAACLLCGDHHTAEDLVQTSMLRTARHWRKARRAPEAYARTVLVNAVRDGARRRRRRVDEVLCAEALEDPGWRSSTLDHAGRLAERDMALAALAALPQRQREVVVLRFYADLSVADTAAATGISQGAVMSYTSRALARLRELIDAQNDQPGRSNIHENARTQPRARSSDGHR